MKSEKAELKVIALSPTAKNLKTPINFYASQPAAGFPAPGDDLVENTLDLNDLLIDNPTSTFFVRVAGDSMEGAKIFDSDILVVDRAAEVSSGRIVVAAIYGELVVKRLKQTSSGLALVSENSDYQPILVENTDDCFVWGVVTGLVRLIK